MNRAEILEAAAKCVTDSRARDHGSAEENFSLIAQFWSAYLGITVLPHDVGNLMALLKIARGKANPTHDDSYVDGAGYLALAGELARKWFGIKRP